MELQGIGFWGEALISDMGKLGNSVYYIIIIVIVHIPSLLTNEWCSYNHVGARNKIEWLL